MNSLVKIGRQFAALMVSLWMTVMMTVPAFALETETAVETASAAGGISPMTIGIAAAIIVLIIIIAVVAKGSGKNKELPEPPEMPKAGEYTIDDTAGAQEKKTLETTLITEESAEGACLTREKTQEKISIHVENFRIGRDRRRVNYRIGDNEAIDRLHCEIIKKEDGFYVLNHSETGTVSVDGADVPQNEERALADGAVLKIADETFKFHA